MRDIWYAWSSNDFLILSYKSAYLCESEMGGYENENNYQNYCEHGYFCPGKILLL